MYIDWDPFVDVNEGDALNGDCLSRLVGREFSVGRDNALYAATPRLKHSGSSSATQRRSEMTTSAMEVMVKDVRRAHCYAKIERDIFIELPEEDPDFSGEKIGMHRLCLYGTRDAAKGW